MPLAGCYVISLRPVGGHDALRRAAAARGARTIGLSPWRIQAQDDAQTRNALGDALRADIVIATSPAAVRSARALRVLRQRKGQAWCAVGSGTAAALRRIGIEHVASPMRMDSEGLLVMAELQSLHARSVGLLAAPGGREAIAPALLERGAHVLRADVYRRVEVSLSPRAMAGLRALRGRPWLALSSEAALRSVFDRLPADLARKLRSASVAAASQRLAQCAREAGFDGPIAIAASARPGDLVAAMAGSIG